ncbi:hypothetical protein KIPB_005141 [Kipferlia bialata]|uniref:adenylate cyclase n=1 Tax=Kipferlia bialata TaxID=797122 RepID=A0A391NW14_9EUKA|nr:hypothetical protein KIPB_003931 [Kipferlia bialata]GCA62683.1 hypothetical protein KIPB_005141 [Kipferlia bialata]|eukprot:g3931.t1
MLATNVDASCLMQMIISRKATLSMCQRETHNAALSTLKGPQPGHRNAPKTRRFTAIGIDPAALEAKVGAAQAASNRVAREKKLGMRRHQLSQAGERDSSWSHSAPGQRGSRNSQGFSVDSESVVRTPGGMRVGVLRNAQPDPSPLVPSLSHVNVSPQEGGYPTLVPLLIPAPRRDASDHVLSATTQMRRVAASKVRQRIGTFMESVSVRVAGSSISGSSRISHVSASPDDSSTRGSNDFRPILRGPNLKKPMSPLGVPRAVSWGVSSEVSASGVSVPHNSNSFSHGQDREDDASEGTAMGVDFCLRDSSLTEGGLGFALSSTGPLPPPLPSAPSEGMGMGVGVGLDGVDGRRRPPPQRGWQYQSGRTLQLERIAAGTGETASLSVSTQSPMGFRFPESSEPPVVRSVRSLYDTLSPVAGKSHTLSDILGQGHPSHLKQSWLSRHYRAIYIWLVTELRLICDFAPGRVKGSLGRWLTLTLSHSTKEPGMVSKKRIHMLVYGLLLAILTTDLVGWAVIPTSDGLGTIYSVLRDNHLALVLSLSLVFDFVCETTYLMSLQAARSSLGVKQQRHIRRMVIAQCSGLMPILQFTVIQVLGVQLILESMVDEGGSPEYGYDWSFMLPLGLHLVLHLMMHSVYRKHRLSMGFWLVLAAVFYVVVPSVAMCVLLVVTDLEVSTKAKVVVAIHSSVHGLGFAVLLCCLFGYTSGMGLRHRHVFLGAIMEISHARRILSIVVPPSALDVFLRHRFRGIASSEFYGVMDQVLRDRPIHPDTAWEGSGLAVDTLDRLYIQCLVRLDEPQPPEPVAAKMSPCPSFKGSIEGQIKQWYPQIVYRGGADSGKFSKPPSRPFGASVSKGLVRSLSSIPLGSAVPGDDSHMDLPGSTPLHSYTAIKEHVTSFLREDYTSSAPSSIMTVSPVTLCLALDIVNFTLLSQHVSSGELVATLTCLFQEFDSHLPRYNATKVKTVGDAYEAMVPVNLTSPSGEPASHGQLVHAALGLVRMAFDMRDTTHRIAAELGYDLDVRIGLSLGPCYGAILSTSSISYDTFGLGPAVARRLEHIAGTGEVVASRTLLDLLEGEGGVRVGRVVRESHQADDVEKRRAVHADSLLQHMYVAQAMDCQREDVEGQMQRDTTLFASHVCSIPEADDTGVDMDGEDTPRGDSLSRLRAHYTSLSTVIGVCVEAVDRR